MPARIVVVHDEPEFADPLAAMLGAAGQDVAVFADPMAALHALDTVQTIEVLVTRVQLRPASQKMTRRQAATLCCQRYLCLCRAELLPARLRSGWTRNADGRGRRGKRPG